MSHISTIKAQIKDLDALKIACEKIGLRFNRDQATYKWWGAKKKPCLHAISVPNKKEAYEIGVNQKNDVYTLNMDTHMNGYGLLKLAGKKCAKLVEAYTQCVAVREATLFAQNQGWSVTEEFDSETSETVIRLRKY